MHVDIFIQQVPSGTSPVTSSQEAPGTQHWLQPTAPRSGRAAALTQAAIQTVETSEQESARIFEFLECVKLFIQR